MRPPHLIVPTQVLLTEARGAMQDVHLSVAPVVDDGRFVGVLSSDDHDDSDTTTAGAAADIEYPTVSSDANLDSALDAMVSAGVNWIPVLERDRVAGVLAMTEVIGGYQTALRRALRLLTGVTGTAVLMEVTVGADSPFAGRRVSRAPWPAAARP
jgi:predicted transcriptional regulator